MTAPVVPEAVVMPSCWDAMATGIKISVAPTDDLQFPFDKRGVWVMVPPNPEEHEAFAHSVGEQVRVTVLELVKRGRID